MAVRSKQALIEELDAARARMQQVVEMVGPDQEIYPTWKMKEVLAHIAGWDEAVIIGLKAVLDNRRPASVAVQGINAYNAQSVEERKQLEWEQVKREWQIARDELKAILQKIDDSWLEKEILYPWGDTGTIPQFIHIFSHHELEHAEEIAALFAQPATPPEPAPGERPNTKADLLEQLDAAHARMQEAVEKIRPDQEIYPPWQMKEVLAHIAGWDDAVIAILQAVQDQRKPGTPAARGADDYNTQSVEERKDLSYEQIQAEWRHNRQTLKKLLQDIPEDQFAQEILYPWGQPGTLASAIQIFADHERDHANEILGKFEGK